MSETVPMTEEGMLKIRSEMTALETNRPRIKKAIEVAREKGDLKENADYHASREELAMLNAKIAHLNGMLANAIIIDPSKAPSDTVALGHTVTIKRVKDKRELTRTLVGAGQAEPSAGKILTTSPIGQAVVGASVGDIVVAELPGGPSKFEIMSIEFG